MWISKRTDYATRAILVLSIRDGEAMKIGDLADACAVPKSVLEQILPTMRNAGLVRSERGPHGGYRLNRAPDDISLERVVRLFEGQLAPIACATRHEPEACPMMVGCALRSVWMNVRDATIEILESVTFADLAHRSEGPWRDLSLPADG